MRVVLHPASALNRNYIDSALLTGWDCTAAPVEPPFPALVCETATVAPDETIYLAAYSELTPANGETGGSNRRRGCIGGTICWRRTRFAL